MILLCPFTIACFPLYPVLRTHDKVLVRSSKCSDNQICPKGRFAWEGLNDVEAGLCGSDFSVQEPLCPSGQTGSGLGEEVPCNGLAAVHRCTHLLGVLYWSSSCIPRGWLLSRI